MEIDTSLAMAFRTNPTDRVKIDSICEDLKEITGMLTDDAIMRNPMTGKTIKVSEIQRTIDIMYMLAHSPQWFLWEVLAEEEIAK